ncbi:MAG: DUF4097 domain-containing protein [Acidobacteriia bacterium]|nr:DUF4097 domain-containing protein [Terriglobia bacterium]
MSMRIPTKALLVILLSAALALPAVASVQGSFERTLTVTGPVDLEVLTHSGDITVRSGPAGTVSIRGKIIVGNGWFSGNRQADVSALEKNPPIRQSGNNIRIDYVNVQNIAIDYEITVPADSNLRTHSGSGDQTIEGLNTKVELESGSGDLRLASLSGGFRVHTGSGNVNGRDISGPITAEAGSGDLQLEVKGSGDVSVHTGSGNIDLRDLKGALRAEAGSGDISIAGVQTGGWEVRTGSGDIQLRLPSEAAFDLEASTGSGSLVVDRPITTTIQGNVRRIHHNISGKVAGGGPPLTVHTGSGDVHIY